MAKLDFCITCGAWIAADTGTMRQGPDGAEIICDECRRIEQRIEHDAKNGALDD